MSGDRVVIGGVLSYGPTWREVELACRDVSPVALVW